jgi:hypothetical protein
MGPKDFQNDLKMEVGLDFITFGQRPFQNFSETAIQKYWERNIIKFLPV